MRYCCFCGRELILKMLLDGSSEKYCSACDHVFFDVPSPAAIVGVINGDKILLARSVGWTHPYWGLIAGHIKTGESAERATIREVQEETGLEAHDLKILGTYPRDPDMLMIGFMAKTDSDKIERSQELEKACWFKLSYQLPLRPNSIASEVVKQIHSIKNEQQNTNDKPQ